MQELHQKGDKVGGNLCVEGVYFEVGSGALGV